MKIMIALTQTNGNKATREVSDIATTIMQDAFVGTYIFPALLRLVKGANKMFDRTLPVKFAFVVEHTEGTVSIKEVAEVFLKTSSVHAVRRAALVLNESIAAMATPEKSTSIYSLLDMKGDKGAEYRVYANGLLRPSVPLWKTLSAGQVIAEVVTPAETIAPPEAVPVAPAIVETSKTRKARLRKEREAVNA